MQVQTAALSRAHQMKSAAHVQNLADQETARIRTVMQMAIEWGGQHPAEMEWIENNLGTPFGASLAEQLNRTGDLSVRQVNAVRAAMGATGAPAVSVERIEVAFQQARAHAVKRPKMNLDTFKFKPAGEKSANPGAIYVTEGGTYLGKVMAGRFLRAGECSDDQERRIVAAASDPDAAARAYGQRTGNCAICGLELTAEESIQRTIGPICASKYGFA